MEDLLTFLANTEILGATSGLDWIAMYKMFFHIASYLSVAPPADYRTFTWFASDIKTLILGSLLNFTFNNWDINWFQKHDSKLIKNKREDILYSPILSFWYLATLSYKFFPFKNSVSTTKCSTINFSFPAFDKRIVGKTTWIKIFTEFLRIASRALHFTFSPTSLIFFYWKPIFNLVLS